MKALIKKKVEYDLKFIKVDAGVRYWEDATVNGVEDETGELIPFKDGDRWKPVIDIENGKIIGWPAGTVAKIHYKVCDDGVYTIEDINGVDIVVSDGYVPASLAPSEDGYGDYIIMNIDGEGNIEDWEFKLNDFTEEDDD